MPSFLRSSMKTEQVSVAMLMSVVLTRQDAAATQTETNKTMNYSDKEEHEKKRKKEKKVSTKGGKALRAVDI